MIDPVSQTILKKIEERAKLELGEQVIAYRGQCPKCMKWSVRETLLKQGCYACGWKPEGKRK